MENIKNYTLNELKLIFSEKSFPKYLYKQVFNWVYKKRIEDSLLMTNISRNHREYLKDNYSFSMPKLIKKEKSIDQTVKFLFELEDKARLETVLIPNKSRRTLCVSTQVGCKFACLFCYSGKGGLVRNLTVSEILNQYMAVSDSVCPDKITNIVFMGIGEPLDNFDNVIKTIKILIEPNGLYFGRRRISISTCGLVPEIIELAKLNLRVKLSISLHAADDVTRSRLMPVNKIYPLRKVVDAAKEFSRRQKYPVTFEYLLIKANTKREDALKLVRLLRGVSYKLNLIPCNCNHGDLKFPDDKESNIFISELKKKGIIFTTRRSRGQDINAACGQLRAIHH
ncbi:MAG: 23S rRNA (adenine(2503)-C(2))-methyltransferase RlmN [Candidatus Omnitrophota bacterium]